MISEVERKVLAAVQRLPLVPEPFGDVAVHLGMTEDDVLSICTDLVARGAIRRFAPSVSHRRFGFSANPMCVLRVPQERLEEVGTSIASDSRVTHAYARDGWKYNVFFMVHGRNREEGTRVAEEIIQRTGISEYQLLFSTRELKKTSFELPGGMMHEDPCRIQSQGGRGNMRIPAVLNLEGPVIIFGGGKVGRRKVDYILKFTDTVTVIDERKVDLPEQATLLVQRVDPSSVEKLIPDGTALVIAALGSEEINSAIARNCRDRGILVNVVDVPDPSTVLFPAISKAGDLTVSVSTSGRCPFLARKIREEFDGTLDTWENWLEVLAPIREQLVGMDEKNRVLQEIYQDQLVKELVTSGQKEEARERAREVCEHVRG